MFERPFRFGQALRGREVLDGGAPGSVRLDADTSTLEHGVYVACVTGATIAETRRLTVVRQVSPTGSVTGPTASSAPELRRGYRTEPLSCGGKSGPVRV